MTYKAACAGLPLGGGKGVIMLRDGPPQGRARRDVLLDFGETVDAVNGAYITAEDVGTSSRDMTVIAEATKHVSGLAQSRGGSGDPSPYTALGVQAAVLASCERAFGDTSLQGPDGRGRRPRQRRPAAREAASPAAGRSSSSPTSTSASARRPTSSARAGWRPTRRSPPRSTCWRRARSAACSTRTPCPASRRPVIAGAANNQLAEDTVADRLAQRGILWAPDFVANAGGIINISVELEGTGYDAKVARRRVQEIGDTLRAIYDAAAGGITPLTAAMELARQRLADPHG